MNQRRRSLLGAAALLFAIMLPASLPAGVVVLGSGPIPAIFGGTPRPIGVHIRNPGKTTATALLQYRIFQAASALAAPIGEPQTWKRLEVLAGQTLVDTAPMIFPLVKGETRFLVRWFDEAEATLGHTEVLVYPTNFLLELQPLSGEQPLGVLDPNDQIKPLLRNLNVPHQDLDETSLAHFTGRLAIVGPLIAGVPIDPHLVRIVRGRAKAGVSVIFLTPGEAGVPVLEPATVVAGFGTGFLIVSQSAALSHFSEDPFAQLNLIRLARLAVKHEQPDLLISAP